MNLKSSTIHEVKVSVRDLEIGMYVWRLDKDWIESPFLFRSFLIEKGELITQLQKECEYVYVDANKYDQALNEAAHRDKPGFNFKSLFGSTSSLKTVEQKRENTHRLREITERKIPLESIVPPKKTVAFDEELGFAKQTHIKITTLMSEFISQVKEGGTIDILIARQPIYDCMTTVLRSPDAMQLVTRLKNTHQSSWQHSMNDSVLAISFGRYLNLENDELITLGLCGLLHDIGNVRISKQELQEAENKKELLRSHTTLGRDILLNCPGELGKTVAEVAYSHHEHLDGSGFPRGLSGEQISPYTRMISIVDVYNTLTVDGKSDKENLTHYDAISLMLKKADSHFDETLLNAFNQCIGTYPVGCVVEMSTGEIAMVVEVNEELKLKPKIMLLTTADKQPCPKKIVNLAETKTSNDGNPYIIKSIVRPEKYGIKL
jgi:HD-GYP domain-containing protein (c-di-GMP phosphodiesterase class II)